MYKKISKSITASLIAAAMMAPTVGSIAPMRIYADNAIISSSFDKTETTWTTVSASPAKQSGVIEDGAYHITVNNTVGADESHWDLQFRNQNLNFKKGHVYKFSFKAKSYREGMEITSQVTDAAGDKYYFVLDGDVMTMGPDMGGTWGHITELTEEYQTFEGTFIPTEDIENAVWSFYYAKDLYGRAGNAQSGDQIWFDDMSIICETCPEDAVVPGCGYTKDTTEDPPVVIEPKGNVIIHSTFDKTIAPWKTTESPSAHQISSIEDGALHVQIEDATGDEEERWDLQTKVKNLYFKADHTYTVSFRAKANREGLELFSQICDASGADVYFVLNDDGMNLGDAFGGDWGKGTKLSTEYKTYTGTFTPTRDIDEAEWDFQYASGTKYGGNAEAGDEIWFDDMMIFCTNCDCNFAPDCGYIVGEEGKTIIDSTFDNNITSWKISETSPAKQSATIEDGAYHITVTNPEGGDKSKWDLQFKNTNLNFKKGHVYNISFKVKSNREGMELDSMICTKNADEVYFVLDGKNEEMHNGPHADYEYDGTKWGTATTLSTSWKTFSGIFTPQKDIEQAEWVFHYAKDSNGYGGNAQEGDELWFDDMSIICETCPEGTVGNGCGYTGGTTEVPPVVEDPQVKYGLPIVDTRFDYNAVPWNIVTASPAKQNFSIDEGQFIITILEGRGETKSKWDLQFRHQKLNFKKGHTYKVSFDAKASRDGMDLCSQITDTAGDKYYFVLNKDKMEMGPDMDGQWGKDTKLTTEYQTFEGIFTPTEDIENAEWSFHYAEDSNGYSGNAQAGDKLYFDNLSIICESCPEDSTDSPCGYTGDPSYGYISRDYAAKTNPDLISDGEMVNYISVNQLGYFPKFAKIATFGDNSGDILHNASKIELTQNYYEFELVDVNTGKVVYENLSSKVFTDKDSGDNVCKLDFSDYTGTGEYYLRIKGEKWRSFPFRIAGDIYSADSHNLLTDALNYFYQNRSGMSIEEEFITSGDASKLARKAVHKNDTAYVQKIWYNNYQEDTEASETYASSKIEASGGWYDAGDYMKSMVNGGMSAWTLQNMYERAILNDSYEGKFDDGSGTIVVPETGNKVPDILEEAAYEIDWMAKMKVTKDDPTWGKFEGLYYHKLQDYKYTELAKTPWDYISYMPDSRIIKPPTFAATLSYAAAAAQAARLWAPYDAQKAEIYLTSAVDAYNAYLTHWYSYDDSETTHPYYNMMCSKEEINETSLYAPQYHLNGGEAYHDSEVIDDAYWAACEIFISASEMGENGLASHYKKELSESPCAFNVYSRLVSYSSKDGEFTSFNWRMSASAGSLSLILHPELLSDDENDKLKRTLLSSADDYIECENEQGYGIAYKYDGPGYYDPIANLDVYDYSTGYRYGSNGMSTTNAIVMAYAYDITYDRKYINGVVQAMDYILGNNPLSFSYITGYGSYSAKNPHHTYWINELDSNYPLAPDGILVGGPSTEISDYAMQLRGFVFGNADNVSQRCYIDSIEAWSVNEASLQWNASLAWVVSFLQDEAGSTPVPVGTPGDVNGDNKVLLNDAVLILQHLGNPDEYPLTEQAKINGDVDAPGSGLTNKDALRIQQFLLGFDGLE